MKKLFITSLFILLHVTLLAQINILRYRDDFEGIKNDSVRSKGFDRLKHIPLSSKTDISFGGELREQFQNYQNKNFGDGQDLTGSSKTSQFWHRLMVHTNLVHAKDLRIFAQVGSTFRFFNSRPLTPQIDENRLNLHQLFLDWHIRSKWMLRLGRQELKYGSHRIITFREGPNNRLSFDGLILMHHAASRKIGAFALSPVTAMPGVFDDRSLEEFVAGIYLKDNNISEALRLEYYFINLLSDLRIYNSVKGRENRQSYGVRIVACTPRFNSEAEVTYQSGKFSDLDISAYSISLALNYKPPRNPSFAMGLSLNYFSGDKSPGDGKLNTYNMLYSKPQFGLTAPIGSSNIINVNPHIDFTPIKRLNTSAGVYWMWRHSVKDGIYSPLASTVLARQSSTHLNAENRQIGTQLTLETNYVVNTHLSFSLDAGYFVAGRYIKESGSGKNIMYLSIKGSFKF